ncbi:hypothetical protein ACFL26_00465 [Patescibacteria group bacterium]
MIIGLALVAAVIVAAGALVVVRKRTAGDAETQEAERFDGGPATIEFVADGEETVRFDCGHDGPVDFHYEVYGRRMETDTERIRERHWKCPECMVADMRQRILRCVCCGRPIFPGNSVSFVAGGFPRASREWGRQHDGDWIACTDCAPYCGMWTGEGVREWNP